MNVTTVQKLYDAQSFIDKSNFYMRNGMYVNDIIHNNNTNRYTVLYSNGRVENVDRDAKIQVISTRV